MAEAEGQHGSSAGATSAPELTPEEIRAHRLAQEREWYLSDEGFLDFVRDSGAAPLAEFQPHGRYCQGMIHWNGEVDPESGTTLYKHKLVLWPRGSFKTSVFDVGQVAWLIARDPNLRILVCSETGRQAAKLARAAMKIIDSPWYRDRFGVHRGESWKLATGSFESALRTREGIKDPTLHAAGVGEVQTGAHWDYVFFDDVVSKENTKTPESLESTWDWLGEIMAQLDPGARLFVIGTLHHFDDLYCRIIKTPAIAKLFEISCHAWSDPIVDPFSDDAAELFFPTRLTRKYVASQKTILTDRTYACFYENQPMTSERQIFKAAYFRVIEDRDIPANVWTYILTDFAFIAEEKKKGSPDYTVFWVVSFDVNRVAYVRDFYRGRWKPSDSVRIVCDLWNRNSQKGLNMKGVSMEEAAFSEVLSSLFEEIRRQIFINPRIIPIAGRNQEVKDLRIESLEPRFKRGDIYFARSLKETHRKWKALFSDMTHWPLVGHDDTPDALSDLDKKDADGKLFLPNPPAGWRSAAAVRQQPPMIDGALNPNYGYPAREMVRADQLMNRGDVWNPNPDRSRGDRSQSESNVFQRPQKNAPKRRFPF